MNPTLTLFFVFFESGLTSHIPVRVYYYVDTKMTFFQAQSYCRQNFTDLATIESTEDMKRLKRPNWNVDWIWIGLNDDTKSWKEAMGADANSWIWSVTGQTSRNGFSNWNTGEPDFNGGKHTCVGINVHGMWSDNDCKAKEMSVCFDATANGKKYVNITSLLSWKDAQAHCREYHTDLAYVESDEDNAALKASITTGFAWIGLYRTAYTWSDKSSSPFRNYANGAPDNYKNSEHCMAENPNRLWNDIDCNASQASYCYLATKLKVVMRMKMQTDVDMTDPQIHTKILQQINAKLQMQGWTDFKLRWKIEPRKQREDNKEDTC